MTFAKRRVESIYSFVVILLDLLVLGSGVLDGGNEVVWGSWGAEVLASLLVVAGSLGGPWGVLLGFVGLCTFPLDPGFAEGFNKPNFGLLALVVYPSINFFIF